MSKANENVPNFERFDTVRVRVIPETEALGLAGLTGTVCGETVPSSSGVFQADIVGNLTEDYAVSVRFGELFREYWFARGSLELLDHSPSIQAENGGKSQTWAEKGNWAEERNRRRNQARIWGWGIIIFVAGVALIVERLKGG